MEDGISTAAKIEALDHAFSFLFADLLSRLDESQAHEVAALLTMPFEPFPADDIDPPRRFRRAEIVSHLQALGDRALAMSNEARD